MGTSASTTWLPSSSGVMPMIRPRRLLRSPMMSPIMESGIVTFKEPMGSSNHGPGLGDALFIGQGRRHLKGHFGGVNGMVRAVQQGGLHDTPRDSRPARPSRRTSRRPFSTAGKKFLGTAPPHDLLFKCQLLGLAGVRIQSQRRQTGRDRRTASYDGHARWRTSGWSHGKPPWAPGAHFPRRICFSAWSTAHPDGYRLRR